MSGIRSYMGWSNIPELDSANTGSDDNPFSGPKSSTPGKVSVHMPTEEWLCKKLSKLNITLVEGYPSRSSEAGGLIFFFFFLILIFIGPFPCMTREGEGCNPPSGVSQVLVKTYLT